MSSLETSFIYRLLTKVGQVLSTVSFIYSHWNTIDMTNAREQDWNRHQVDSIEISLSKSPAYWSEQIIDFIRNVLPLFACYWFCSALCLPVIPHNALFYLIIAENVDCQVSSVAGLVMAGPQCFCNNSPSEGQSLCSPWVFKDKKLNHLLIILLKLIFSKYTEVPFAKAL